MGDSEETPAAGWYWGDYWSRGPSDVSGGGADGPTDAGRTDPVWLSWFSQLTPGARVLDLATGGGAVLRYAAAASTKAALNLDLTGVDFALLPADPVLDSLGVRRIGQTPIESLPFADASFDAVTSQFGIEYGEARRSLGEAGRVLRAGGTARFLLHHIDSEITHQAFVRLKAHDSVIGDGRVVQLCRDAYAAQLRSASEDEVAETARNVRAEILALAARVGPDPTLSSARYALSYLNDLAMGLGRYDPMSALLCLDDFVARNAAWRERHAQQIAVAMNQSAMEAFVEVAEHAGLRHRQSTAWRDEAGGLMGWLVDFAREGDAPSD